VARSKTHSVFTLAWIRLPTVSIKTENKIITFFGGRMGLLLPRTVAVVVLCALVGYGVLRLLLFSVASDSDDWPRLECDKVDVVYTWVNGSDPVHVRNLKKYKRDRSKDEENFFFVHFFSCFSLDSEGRYRDYETLRYSLRSVHQLFRRVSNAINNARQIKKFFCFSRLASSTLSLPMTKLLPYG
jgi:hypothetical protein